MNIKIGKIELKDWKYQSYNEGTPYYWYGWYRPNFQDYSYDNVGIYDHLQNSEWSVNFGGHLYFLHQFWDTSNIIGTADEAMKQVDEFIFRFSKLTAFL